MAFWACKSCLSYAHKVNLQFSQLNKRVDELEERVEKSKERAEEIGKEVKEVRTGVEKVSETVAEMKERIELTMYEELKERESKRRNIILHGLEEPSRTLTGNRERMEDDRKACLKVLRMVVSGFTREDMKYCRRIGERVVDAEKPRPVVVGLRTEVDKDIILEKIRNLKNTRFEYISVVADLTKKQRQEEEELGKVAGRKNKDLTEEEKAKNLNWIVVGRKGEKRLIKTVQREQQGARDKNSQQDTGEMDSTRGNNKRGREEGSEEEMQTDTQGKRPRSRTRS